MKRVTLVQLMKITSMELLSQSEQLEILASLFDLAHDHSSEQGLEHGINLAGQIEMDKLVDENYTLINYFLANAWSSKRKIKYAESAQGWQFQIEELENEILCLRRAINSTGFNGLDSNRQCQMYTNLAGSLNFIGRFVEAQQYWNKALAILPDFAMAIGNKANGLSYYGKVLFDTIHANLFQVFAYHYFVAALKYGDSLHIEAKEGFRYYRDYLGSYIGRNFHDSYLKRFPDLDDFDLGDNQALKNYRLWCLENQLFINPLNDLGPFARASHDCLHLPTLTLSVKRAPVSLNLYNQVKQEFGTARYSFFQYQSTAGKHLSDIDIPLIDTMESICYSYSIEQLKIAFRLSYSILDKIAYLLNDYLDLHIKPSKVSFRGLWYEKEDKMILRDFFTKSENWALRGLFWLSKDLYEKNRDFDTVLDPEAKEIALIRNYIEHKGFKVVSDRPLLPNFFTEEDISYAISKRDFEAKTLNLLKLTRAAIIYLAIAIVHEERRRDHSGKPSYPVQSGIVPDFLRG
ncbi:LA2681 family HEPN domain-containing protein [Pedobacter sp. UYP1]|uniref:LA2681 family HEPN domain-containing protein n=1 Tax=Pedobacter sp. UYP1 TaxID=1756396 RepID=UPI003392C33A